jgi:hypothetical protein
MSFCSWFKRKPSYDIRYIETLDRWIVIDKEGRGLAKPREEAIKNPYLRHFSRFYWWSGTDSKLSYCLFDTRKEAAAELELYLALEGKIS